MNMIGWRVKVSLAGSRSRYGVVVRKSAKKVKIAREKRVPCKEGGGYG